MVVVGLVAKEEGGEVLEEQPQEVDSEELVEASRRLLNEYDPPPLGNTAFYKDKLLSSLGLVQYLNTGTWSAKLLLSSV